MGNGLIAHAPKVVRIDAQGLLQPRKLHAEDLYLQG